MTNTARLALPYPGDLDVPNGPAQIQALAERLDLVVPKFYTPKIIATEQSRENAAFGVLGTADEITGIVMPENGWIEVGYRAKIKNSVESAGKVGLFLGANQVKNAEGGPLESGNLATLATRLLQLGSGGFGISTLTVEADVTTGQVAVTGTTKIFAAAGTYAVSMQFKATSGTISAKERKLWVIGYGNS